MTKIRRLCATVAIILGVCGVTFFASPARAATTAGHVTIMVLDMSGSMAQNDPNGLRCSAANAYIDLSGPGNFIGVVGLDNATGKTGGPHNFTLAQKWADPTEMATVSQRQNLRQTIASTSNNCKPDGNTPTYDALNQALGMLQSSTQSGHLSGSVILLTDGDPEPDASAQIAAIKADLAPKFKTNGWPIDTIALGQPGSYHDFLSSLAGATSGKFYDDSKGPVSGVSPLNLAPFFVDLFALRNGRTPGATLPPTNLSGGTTSRNFAVGSFVSHLDVIAVKDQPGTTVTVTAPNGHTIAATGAGAFVSTDLHYVIFAIDTPQAGPWQLNVTGGGMFLMDSLVVSTLTLDITTPTKGKAEPLGQPVTITAALRDQGSAVIGQQFALKARIIYAGNGTATPLEVLLADPNGTSDYSGTVTIPATAPAGTYEIDVTAQAASETAVAAATTVSFEVFPQAVLLSPVTNQPTTDRITAHVVTWDAGLRFIYSAVPFYNSYLYGWRPANWPLQGKAANGTALYDGQVLVGGKLYPNATVTATATKDGTHQAIPLTVENEHDGTFRVFLPSSAQGNYTITLTTTGAYKDSFGDLSTAAAPVGVTVGIPSLADEIRAWAITLLYSLGLYLFALFFIYGPINYLVRAKPNGRARLVDMASFRRARSRAELDSGMPIRWRGLSLQRYFAPNKLPAGELALPNNLVFLFRWGNEVAVRVRKPRGKEAGAQWSVESRNISHADGAETILPNMRISYTESGQTFEYKFEQDVRNAEEFGTSGISDGLDKAAGALNLRDRLPRRGGSMRHD